MMWLAAMRIRAACDHVLHANSTLVDRVDLATPLSLSSQRLPAPRLLLPRSGLSRSDFVRWPIATFRFATEFDRYRGIADMAGLGAGSSRSRMTLTGPRGLSRHSTRLSARAYLECDRQSQPIG